jgi:hypothetical protein
MNDEMKEYDLPETPLAGETPENKSVNAEKSVEPVGEEELNPEFAVSEPSGNFESEGIETDTGVEKKPPSKFQQLIHTVSVWVLGILGFALVVFLVFFFVMYRPMKQAHDALFETNTGLEEQLSDYRVELETLTDDYQAVTSERDDLLSDAVLYQGYVHFLNLKNDMLLLQKAYLEKDLGAATLALTKANKDFEAFVPALTKANEPMVDVLRSKLALLSTVVGDTAANIEEVETIYDFLLEMEDDIFGLLD